MRDSNEERSDDTIIFYKIDNGTFTISFFLLGFYINAAISIEVLKQRYDETYNNEEDIMLDDAKKMSFIEWVDNTYMDGRGVKEV